MIFTLILLLSFQLYANDSHTLKRFVFGSCNDQNRPQPLWKEMLKQKPDLFIWGGDNVYSDKEKPTNLRLAFEKQNRNPDYQLFKSKVKIIGTWDDHDFGGNNTTGRYSRKKEAQKLFLDFLGEPRNSPRRKQEGIYTSYTFGKVKFILLDNRYFMDLDPRASLLGEKQWQWLEKELKNNKAKVTFIMSGLSILSPVHPLSDGAWPNYPTERDRLLELVERQGTGGVVFLTGDMHFSSIFRRRGHLEFLSSGLTHRVPRVFWWYLGRRYETSFFGLNYGQVDIAWDNDTPILTMSIRDRYGAQFHKRTFRLDGNEWVQLYPLEMY
ncbi:MAG: alkaline phosphatase D family protein [Bacteriovoracia bacterium]